MSGFGVVGRLRRNYHAMLYYQRKGENQIEIHFVITKDLESHATLVKQHYTAMGAILGSVLLIQFESDSITLKLPPEGIVGGWKIIPPFHPVITKQQVDSFRPGLAIPSCQLRAVWTKQSKPSVFTHRVTLLGAKEPFNFINIVLNPDSSQPGVPREGLHSKYPAGLESEPELSDLMNVVAAKIPGKWRDVGLQLGLDQGVLGGIASISPGDTNHCYRNVFTRWKKQNSTTHPQTWSTIVQALRAVGEKLMAYKIESELSRHPFTTGGVRGLHSNYPAGLDSEPELPDLMNEIAAEIPGKWREVGLQLGLDQEVLEQIALISPGDTNSCYINVFTQWKNQNSTTRPYTWSTIVQALKTPAVGEERLADKILSRHPFTTGGVRESDFHLEKLLEKYRHQEKIKHKSLKCLFTGPPRTGKTTLKKRLLKIIKNLKSSGMTSPSGGFENPISAVIGETKERDTALLESNIDWQVQHDVLDEAQIVLEFIDQQPTTNVVHPSPYSAQTAPALPMPYPPPPGSDPRVQPWSIVTGYPDSPILDPSHSNQPREAAADTFEDAKQLMQEVLASKGLRTIEDIEKITILYLMDTGGQPEFHEIMPLILSGPALHLVFFNLTFNLNDPVVIQFCKQDGKDAMITYMSSYTGEQMIYQLLSSHYCLSKDLSPDSKSAAVLFGTHLDQLKHQEDQGKKRIEEIDGSLKQLLSNAEFHNQGFLTYPRKDEESTLFIPVNNYSGDEKDLQQLQAFLKQVIDDHFDPVELPSSWLLFHLILRHRYENLGVCKLEESRALAKGCGLDKDDVPKVLQYIHRHLGTILFYEEVQGLNELVICDPNVLFKRIFHLVAVSFAGERDYNTSALEVRKTGEIPSEVVERICAQSSESPLKNQHIIDLLKHFKILTELSGDATTFFMPCLLQPDNSCLVSCELLQSLQIPPLLVCFDGNYIPIGVFSALVVKLSQSSWEPDRKSRYRNHILFRTDLFSVKLIVYPAYLEFRILIANKGEPKETLHQFCMATCKIVVDTLKSVLDLHEHTRKTKFQLGFYCPGSFQANVTDDPHFGGCFPSQNHTNPKTFACSKCPCYQVQCRLPHETTIWFDYWKDEKETVEDSGHNTTLRTANKKPYFGAPSPKRPKTISELDCDQPQSFQYENVDDSPLDEHSLRTIVDSISTLAAKWFNLGVALGLSYGKLTQIESNHSKDSLRCLTETVIAWLQSSSNPSWKKLVSALRSPSLDRVDIATMIATAHPSH